jgi:hypothetical protein
MPYRTLPNDTDPELTPVVTPLSPDDHDVHGTCTFCSRPPEYRVYIAQNDCVILLCGSCHAVLYEKWHVFMNK